MKITYLTNVSVSSFFKLRERASILNAFTLVWNVIREIK